MAARFLILGALLFGAMAAVESAMPKQAVHGGDFFRAIGEDFADLGRREGVISADVLDAWYPPTPKAVAKIKDHLEWLIRTSPPTHAEGLRDVISQERGIPAECLVLGGGTSSLMHQAIPRLVAKGERALILDPMYGEYAHILEQAGAEIVRHELPLDTFAPDLDRLIEQARTCRLAILVNPNSPTGVAVDRAFIQALSDGAPDTWLWLDETYIDFPAAQGGEWSAEPLVGDRKIIVSKSMSKFYGLSGLRVGYLACPADFAAELATQNPPWAVGMMGQLAAIEALRDHGYYHERALETHKLRQDLADSLTSVRVVPSATNFLMMELPNANAAEVVAQAAKQGVYLRDCDSLSPRFAGQFLRTAVKDGAANQKIAAAINAYS